jgi:hypothetical protein
MTMLRTVEMTILVQPYTGGTHKEVLVKLMWLNTPRVVLDAFPTWQCLELIRSGLATLGNGMPTEISVDMNQLLDWHFHEVEQLSLFEEAAEVEL